MFHVVISDSIYWMKVEIWGDEKKPCQRSVAEVKWQRTGRGGTSLSDTPQGSDLKTYSAPNGEG